MTDMLSRSETSGIARSRALDFRRLVMAVLIVEALLGLLVLLAPGLILDNPLPGSRILGAFLLSLAILQIPILVQPAMTRLLALLGIVARVIVGLTVLLVPVGPVQFGLVEVILGIAIYVTFRSFVIATLQAHP
jgi:hypothetical protein